MDSNHNGATQVGIQQCLGLCNIRAKKFYDLYMQNGAPRLDTMGVWPSVRRLINGVSTLRR